MTTKKNKIHQSKADQPKVEKEKTDHEKKETHHNKGKQIDYKKQAEDNLEGWKRTKADFENYKKEEARKIEDLGQFMKANSSLEILSILDNMEEAIKHISKEDLEIDWVKGILVIQKQVIKIIEGNGIKEIEAIDKEFDPYFHEAIGEVIGKKENKDKVVQVFQKGYMMGEKVLRPVRVCVGKEKE